MHDDITSKMLEQSSKLEIIKMMASGVSHDFKNVLSGIITNLDLAMLRLDKLVINNKNISKDIEEIIGSLKRANKVSLKAKHLVERLITFSLYDTPVLRTKDLNKLIKDITEFSMRGKNIKLKLNLHDIKKVKLDEIQIFSALQNLIINACQAMDNEGELYIETKNVKIDQLNFTCPVCNTSFSIKKGRYVLIEVTDTGEGISKEHLDKVFTPYFTTKKNGMGLGLPMVRQAIHDHEGNIHICSVVKKGTTFSIYLPISNSPIKEQPIKILFIDDDEPIRQSFNELFKALGYYIVTCADGKEGLKIYCKDKFDVVICDVFVGNQFGAKYFIKEILNFDKDAKVVVSSAARDTELIVNYLKYGFKSVIVKPYSSYELVALLKNVLNGTRFSEDSEL